MRHCLFFREGFLGETQSPPHKEGTTLAHLVAASPLCFWFLLSGLSGLNDRLHHGIFKDRACFTTGSIIGDLRHHDGNDFFLWIDPEVRIVGAAPPEAAGGQRSPP